MKTLKTCILLLAFTLATFTGCKKFLEEKSDKKLVIPNTPADLQALLDNYNMMSTKYAAAGETSSDDYYLTDADYTALPSIFNRRMYTWERDGLFDIGYNGNDWSSCYKAIYIATSVLDELKKLPQTTEINHLKGQALVYRAARYLDAVRIWSKPYEAVTAGTSPGIPLRMSSDFNEKSVRVTIGETYDRIFQDLKTAIPLLPEKAISPLRPSKAAVYGLLARACLDTKSYAIAGAYADSCLKIYSSLIDFNTLRATASYPIGDLNAEVVFYGAMSTPDVLNVSRAKIIPELVQSYTANDLRRTTFFRTNADGSVGFKGNYTGSSGRFTGISVNEMMLTSAESAARSGNKDRALALLNQLLSKRWKTGTFVPLSAATSEQALDLILKERRKELLMRGLRWADLRRLNTESRNIVLQRSVNGTVIRLEPNSSKYALPLPDDVIALSGMPQNER